MSERVIVGWKVFTHDLRPPLQGGHPVWSGELPYALQRVRLDTGDEECAAGWNFCRELPTAFGIAGLWPDGRPSRAFQVSSAGRIVERGRKCRAATLRLEREATEGEVAEAVQCFSRAFAPHEEWMAAEQLEWRRALARPTRDEKAVAAGLRTALAARGLSWQPRRYDTAWAARAAWAAWAARAARAAWAARDARAAWDAWDAWAARAAWDAKAAWAAWDASAAWDARAAWDAWDARDTRDALALGFAARQRWVQHDALMLTHGIRDAYAHGLEIAVPTGPNVLGWSMDQ